MTQTEVAKKMGMSQVQISRMGKKDIEEAKRNLPQIVMHVLAESLFQTRSGKGEKKQSIFAHFPEHYWVLEFNLFSFQTPLSELCRSREKQVRRGVKGLVVN